MATLKDVMIYICKEYPRKSELSKARFTKMIYLCDWKFAIESGKQLTDIRWLFNNYGPYVDDVIDLARNDAEFEVNMERNNYGAPKELITFVGNSRPNLVPEEERIINFIIEKTKPLYWDDFINLVYSTYPIVTRPRYDYLDLIALAEEYKKTVRPHLREVA